MRPSLTLGARSVSLAGLAGLALLGLGALGLGCLPPTPPPPQARPAPVGEGSDVMPRPAAPLTPREAVVEAAVARAAGPERLGEIAAAPTVDLEVRAAALRGLGRRGDPPARALLEASLASDDAAIVAAAAHGLGLTDDPGAEAPLLAALARAEGASRAAIADALGRVGEASSVGPLSALIGDPEVEVAAAAARSLGRLGRRAVGLDDGARAALIAASAAADDGLRGAATYALANRHMPEGPLVGEAALLAALIARTRDPEAEIRATALTGLGRRDPLADEASAAALLAGLEDPAWRVSLAALRGIPVAKGEAAAKGASSGKSLKGQVSAATPESAALAAIVARAAGIWATIVEAGDPGPALHVLEEALARLGPAATSEPVRALAERLVSESAALLAAPAPDGAAPGRSPGRSPHLAVAASRIHCRALALAVRGGARGDLEGCGGPPSRGSARHLRRVIWAEVAGEGLAGGLDALISLAGDDDPRVQAAALEAAKNMVERTDSSTREGAQALLARGLAGRSPAVVGAAADAIRELVAAPESEAWMASLAGDVVAALGRATGDPELELSLVRALTAVIDGHRLREPSPTTLDLGAARGRCEAALAGVSAPLRAAARACLTALGDPPAPASAPAPALADLPRPPFAAARGGELQWTVDTTQGVIIIALDPEVAPWSVGALAELSRRGFYNGLAWHRVVPGFVAQGGDPTGTGAGGPGFTLPAEPSWAPFERGAVGIADAGPDTGGSQWFIMHARAPHLGGRYTRVGAVIEGLDVVDRLTTDDQILTATVEAMSDALR